MKNTYTFRIKADIYICVCVCVSVCVCVCVWYILWGEGGGLTLDSGAQPMWETKECWLGRWTLHNYLPNVSVKEML